MVKEIDQQSLDMRSVVVLQEINYRLNAEQKGKIQYHVPDPS